MLACSYEHDHDVLPMPWATSCRHSLACKSSHGASGVKTSSFCCPSPPVHTNATSWNDMHNLKVLHSMLSSKFFTCRCNHVISKALAFHGTCDTQRRTDTTYCAALPRPITCPTAALDSMSLRQVCKQMTAGTEIIIELNVSWLDLSLLANICLSSLQITDRSMNNAHMFE